MTIQAPIQFPVRERDGKWEVIIPPFGISDKEYVECETEDDARTFAASWILWGECVTNHKSEWPSAELLQKTADVVHKYGFRKMSRFFRHRLEDLRM